MNRKFRGEPQKNVFPVLSYCLIPVTLGAVVTVAGTHLFVDLLVFPHGHGSSMSIELPNFAFDFAGDTAIFLVRRSFSVIFLAWAFVLFVKATRISHGFGTGKAAGVLALAAVTAFALTIFVGLLASEIEF